MLSFTVERRYSSSAETVWQRVSDIRNMPAYWHGQKGIELSRSGTGDFEAVIDFAFGGRGKAVLSVDTAALRVTLDYCTGPFTGTQEIKVGDGVLSASWNIRFTGAYRLLERFNRKHFRTGTEHALERLCQL